ncbi:SPB1 protein, partial [Crotophaga sulcirostris]|nr:SPB1 protein [Crotophaga sulcirostris]
ANLTLMALKLACEFLCKGGWFITKVFRSRDYQPLLWIFQQFFSKVQATKPQASRNESAEIFVVCQGYQAPDKIDSKFFDPKYAFKEVEVPTKSVSELVSKKKPKAEGYADGDMTLYHRFTLMDFLKAPNPVDFLSKANEITLGDGELENHSSTTEELRQCCKDIRVLGRKELRALLNWRTKLRRFLAKKLKEQAKELDINLSSGEEEEGREEEEREKKSLPKATADEVVKEEEEEEVELALTEMKAKELAELKRKKKKILKEQRKQRERVELKMDLPGVSIADDGDTSMFSLRTIQKTPLLNEVTRGDMASADALLEIGPGDDDIYVSDHEEDDDVSLASDLDPEELLEIEARQRRLEWERREQGAKRWVPTGEEEEEEGEEQENPLLVPLEEKSVLAERQTNLWFGKDAFAGIEDDADEELELRQSQMLAEKQRESQRSQSTKKEQKKKPQEESPAEPPPAADTGPDAGKAQDEDSSDDDSSSDDERPLIPADRKWGRVEPCGFEVVPIEKPGERGRTLDAEGLALGSVIATSKKARRDLIDDSFNRYSFNEDEGELPEWFTEEEKQHRRKQVPVDRQTVEAYRQRWREINARPIKKVAEAKARKKRRMLKKMEQMKKKAEAVVNTVDISEREKVAQLRRIYKKAGLAKEKRQVTYLVAKKGVGRKVRRPPGVKGQFKVVDSR